MNFFENELRRITDMCGEIKNPVFAGRACYGDIGGDNRMKLQFVTTGKANRYEALKVKILNRTDGEVDNLLFRFSDFWVKNPDSSYREGIISENSDGKINWYAYRPTDADIKSLADEVNAYVGVFVDRSAVMENEKKPKSIKKNLAVATKKLEGEKHNAPPTSSKVKGRGDDEI